MSERDVAAGILIEDMHGVTALVHRENVAAMWDAAVEVQEIHVSRLLYLEGAADAAEAGNMHVKVKPHSRSLFVCLDM